MKRTRITTIVMLGSLMTIFATVNAQEHTKHEMNSGKAGNVDLARLGKPTFSESKNGMKVQVWLLTRAEHDRLLSMPGKNQYLNGGSIEESDEANKSDQGMNSTTPNPEIAVVVLDDIGGKVPIQNMILEIITKSPSGVPLSKGLIAARGHYAAALNFAEKGPYQVSLRITRNGMTTMMYFETPIIIS